MVKSQCLFFFCHQNTFKHNIINLSKLQINFSCLLLHSYNLFPSNSHNPFILKMNLQSYLIILTTLLLSEIPVFQCQNPQYQTCTQPFTCANIRDISYPFYGGSRPSSCGYPGFELTCNSDSETPLINITSLTYRVLEIDNSTQTLRVSRQDLRPCPTDFLNTTLDSRIFNYSSDANDRNITLFYGCPRELPQVPNRYSCTVNGMDTSVIYATEDSSIPGLGTLYTCTGSIFIPVDEATSPQRDLLDAVASGFSIEWSANNSNCDSCVVSGGVCGYEQSRSSFACHCADRTYELTCGNPNGGMCCSALFLILLMLLFLVLVHCMV